MICSLCFFFHTQNNHNNQGTKNISDVIIKMIAKMYKGQSINSDSIWGVPYVLFFTHCIPISAYY